MPDLLTVALSAAIALTIGDGRYAERYETWFGDLPGTEEHPLPPISAISFPSVEDAAFPGSVLETVLTRGSLRIGYALMGPPFSFEQTGDVVGWDLDFGHLLTSALAEAYGRPLKAEAIQLPASPFPARLFDELDVGQVDIVLSDLAITDERKERVDFTAPYLTVTFGLLCRSDVDFATLAEANRSEVKIVVLRHAFLNALAERYLPNAQHVFVTEPLDMVPKLLDGSADAVLLPIASIRAYIEQAQAKGRALHRAGLVIDPQALRAIAVRKTGS